MAVGRYDDDMRSNPKLIAAGDRAAWLWWCGVQYCRNALTDGFIPRIQVAALFAGAVNVRNSVAALVRAGLVTPQAKRRCAVSGKTVWTWAIREIGDKEPR